MNKPGVDNYNIPLDGAVGLSLNGYANTSLQDIYYFQKFMPMKGIIMKSIILKQKRKRRIYLSLLIPGFLVH
jgi:hypothetical protein